MSPLDSLEWMFKMQTAPSETAAIIIEPILGGVMSLKYRDEGGLNDALVPIEHALSDKPARVSRVATTIHEHVQGRAGS